MHDTYFKTCINAVLPFQEWQHSDLLINLATATLATTPYHIVTKQENLKEEEVKKEMKSQPKHPWCKKSYGQESKKRPC